MTDIQCIILAAGEGVRMCSSTPKVLHKACDRPLIGWVLEAAKPLLAGKKPIVVAGCGARQVKDHLGESAQYVIQESQQGTGHAVMCAIEHIRAHEGVTLVLAGDMPLIETAHLASLVALCEAGAAAALLTAVAEAPGGYGRVLRDGKGNVLGIVEERDADEAQKQIREINASVYAFQSQALLEALSSLNCHNAQGEYYLTDTIEHLAKNGGSVTAVTAEAQASMGVNDRVQLAAAQKALQKRVNEALMRQGVTIIDPENTYIGASVRIGRDALVYPGCVIEGPSEIGEGALIYPGCLISGSFIGAGAEVRSSQIVDARVDENARIGPFVHLRPEASVGKGCRVGNFVEIKNARVDDGAKVSHLSYIGDGSIGKKANIGCGVVFVNYDGQKKSRTVVGDGAFVGCNANLVAPVTVGAGAYIAAGSTITDDVPEGALGIARARQSNKDGWALERAKKANT